MIRIFGSLLLSVCALTCGCRKPQEFRLENELKPTTMRDLLELPMSDLDRVDIGRMNLICVRDAIRSETVDVESWVHVLDEWAMRARVAEEKYRHVFDRDPARYDRSYAKFRAINLALTIKEDFKCRYQMSLVDSGAMDDVRSFRFFKNAHDVFILGLLRRHRGTCSSIPVLLAALGRRLGYPIYLKSTLGHLFCCWDDGVERFNIDTSLEGVDTPDDDSYVTGRYAPVQRMSSEARERERILVRLDNRDALAIFLQTLGANAEANGMSERARMYFLAASRYCPSSTSLQRLASRPPSVIPADDPGFRETTRMLNARNQWLREGKSEKDFWKYWTLKECGGVP